MIGLRPQDQDKIELILSDFNFTLQINVDNPSRFNIYIQRNENSVTPNINDDLHPHAPCSMPCLGDFSPGVSFAISCLDFNLFGSLIIDYLQRYDPSDAYGKRYKELIHDERIKQTYLKEQESLLTL